jgi:CRISPR-associated endoribonuclease Cas6
MRICISGRLSKNSLTFEYRKAFISYLKHALMTQEESLYETYYKNVEGILKEFATAFIFGVEKVSGDVFELKNNDLKVVITTADMAIGIRLYNAVVNQLKKSYPIFDNTFTATYLTFEKEPLILKDSIEIKFLSPLLVRDVLDHKKYLSIEDDRFSAVLLANTKEQMLRLCKITPETSVYFEIEPIRAKRIVVKHYDQRIDGLLGSYRLSGPPSILKYLYDAGMGSRKSAGFGVFKITKGA